MTFSGAAAAAVIRSEKKIVAALRSAGAVSSGTGIALHDGRLIERNALRRLLRHKAVLQTGDLYWLDEAAYEEMKNLRRSRVFMILFGLAAVLIIVSAVVIAKS